MNKLQVLYIVTQLLWIGAGSDFTDSFTKQDTQRWAVNSGRFQCRGKQCVYLTMENIKMSFNAPPTEIQIPRPHGYVQLALRNDCYGEHCCQNGRCTPFTAGSMSSVRTYGFGSFLWYAAASFDPNFDNPDIPESPKHVEVFTCFSIESVPPALFMYAAICINSRRPFEAGLVYEQGVRRHFEYVQIPFQIPQVIAVFRIDYHQCEIRWIINDVIYKYLQYPEIPKQDSDVRIAFGMIPAKTRGFGTKHGRIYPELDEIRIMTRVFRFKYFSKYVPVIVHDEPLLKEDSTISIKGWILLSIIATVALLIATYRICMKKIGNGGKWIK